jgi:hypothetical protein
MSKALKSIKKVVKKAWDNKIIRGLIIAATIYVGGAALGAWGSPFSSINGALVKGAAGAGAPVTTSVPAFTAGGTSAATTATTAAGATTGATTGATLGNVAATAARAAPTGIPGMTVVPGAGAGSVTAGQVAGTVAPVAAAAPAAPSSIASSVANPDVAMAPGPTQKPGIISRMMSGVSELGTIAKDNPLAAGMLVSGAASAMGPDEIDLMREQERLRQEKEDEDLQRRNENWDVSGISLPQYQQSNLKFASTGEPIFANGIIQRRMT